MFGIQLADVSTRYSGYPQDKYEVRCKDDGNHNRHCTWVCACMWPGAEVKALA